MLSALGIISNELVVSKVQSEISVSIFELVLGKVLVMKLIKKKLVLFKHVMS